MRMQFGIVAQSVAVDRFSNRLSIFNVCESIEAPRFPIFVPEIVFVLVLRREPTDPTIFDTMLNVRLGEMAVGQANMHVDFESLMMNRQIANFQGLPIFAPGVLEFSFNLPDGSTISTIVPVVQNPALPPLVEMRMANTPGPA
jgi:hypothetical protein